MKNTTWITWLNETNETNEADATSVHHGELLGGKGANLRRLATLGMPVPRGFVITTDAYRAFVAANNLEPFVDSEPASLPARIIQAQLPTDLRAAILVGYEQLGIGAVAVRSSGTAEDLATASFAGQHDTFLNVVGPEAVLSAVQACWASLWTPRAIAYRRQHDWVHPVALAVVVQAMVPAEAAGVAFTANPVTGNRNETTVSAVRGLGERLVSGEGMADEWVVRGVGADAQAMCQRNAENAITGEQALAVAALARRIERGFGAPQDMEWAIDDNGNLFVLQARPMTALPELVETVSWRAPIGSGWMRNFRLGEWLPDPVTPLCESWLLDRIEEGEVASEEHDFGLRPRPPYHVLVHGWYFSSPIGGGLPLRGVAKAVTRHPRQIAALALSTNRPDLAERPFIAPVARRWQNELLPGYQHLVAFSEAQLDGASTADLIRAIDAVASMAGEYLWALSVVGGHAWKAEHALARFCREHLPERATHSHQELLLGLPVGLPAPYPAAPAHAVQSLDWIRPTLGETQSGPVPTDALIERRTRMAANRRTTEAACRTALATRPRLRRRFNKLLALAQRYAILREEQASWFTLGWPFLRCAVLRLGEDLRQRGAIDHVEDVFFLTRAELESNLEPGKEQAGAVAVAVADSLPSVVVARRREWERQRRLNPPLVLGNPLGARLIARATNAMRVPDMEVDNSSNASRRYPGHDVLTGMPASPGSASGPVRVVHGPEDFERFQSGEVLVAQVTTPAWTPLFGRAAAVVTDGGSLAAHASLVAREYGVPAVVAAGDATARLHDGQVVRVDGNVGQVVPLGQSDTENTED